MVLTNKATNISKESTHEEWECPLEPGDCDDPHTWTPNCSIGNSEKSEKYSR